MAKPVDNATFHHQKEACLVACGQELNCFFGNIRKSQISLLPVDCRGQTRRIDTILRLHVNDFPCPGRQCLKILSMIDNHVPRITQQGIEIYRRRIMRRKDLFPSRSPVKVESGFSGICSDLVIHLPIRLMRVKNSGCCMIDGNTRGDAHCLSGLLCFTGNTVQNTTILPHPDAPVLCFCSGGQRGSGSSRTSHGIRSGIGCHIITNRE